MEVEIKIRRRTESEIAERIEQVLKRKCYFCSHVVAFPYGIGEKCSSGQQTWLGVNMCGYCHGQTFTYHGRYFFENGDETKPLLKRRRHSYMNEEQTVCSLLHKLNNQLKREIHAARMREQGLW